jgi:hypothetical protein
MLRQTLSVLLAMVLPYTCGGQKIAATGSDEAVPLLMNIFSRANLSGSLEFSASCAGIGHARDFPRLEAPVKWIEPLQALRDAFREDPKMQVKQDRNGIVRMVETDVPKDVLDVMISHVAFRRSDGSGGSLYDPQEAMEAILSTTEVMNFRSKNNVSDLYGKALDVGHAPFSAQSPHVSGDLYNAKLSEALDHLLLTFPGVWVYKNCPAEGNITGRRSVMFSFYENNPGWASMREPYDHR